MFSIHPGLKVTTREELLKLKDKAGPKTNGQKLARNELRLEVGKRFLPPNK